MAKMSKEEYAELKRRQREKYAAFETAVAREFGYLESEFGFVRGQFERERDSHPMSKAIKVVYMGEKTAVEIEWVLYDISFGVTIHELEGGEIPSYRGFSKRLPVGLEELIQYLTGGKAKPILPKSSTKLFDLLHTRLKKVVREYARRLREYGDPILRGDLSVLPAVRIFQVRHNEMLRNRLFEDRGEVHCCDGVVLRMHRTHISYMIGPYSIAVEIEDVPGGRLLLYPRSAHVQNPKITDYQGPSMEEMVERIRLVLAYQGVEYEVDER